MIKAGTLYREKMLEKVKLGADSANGVFFVGFNALSSEKINEFRTKLRAANAKVLVAKNNVIARNYEEDLNEILSGPTAVIFSNEDVVEAAKIICDFRKENETLAVKGGLMDAKVLTGEEVEALSKLPSRQVLLGMLVNVIASPITSLVNDLSQIIAKLPQVINAIKEKKEKE